MTPVIAPLTRRTLLGGVAGFGAVAALPGIAMAAAATHKRFVFVIQRGAADGLALVQPHGDPALRTLRAPLVDVDAIPLDTMFSLHPALTQLGAMFRRGEAVAHHAVATAYRDRSHFDGQNVLESGGARPYQLDSGWIARLLAMLPKAEADALALAPAVPLAMRGNRPVATYSPNGFTTPNEDLLRAVTRLYAADPRLDPMWQEALRSSAIAGDIGGREGRNGADLGKLAASFLTRPDGARVMMIETGGWDTHSAQAPRLAAQLRGLDGMLGALREGLGAVWRDTLVLVATEFGRTAAVNGTGGTDHGTASVALLLGGSLGARRPVLADWPGLAADSLHQGRDLRPTRDLSAVIAAALASHYGLPETRLATLMA